MIRWWLKEMSAALKRIRELEMENEVLRAAAAYLSQEVVDPKRPTRSWKKLIAQGKVTLTVAARVLKFSRQAFYKWRAKPVSDRQLQEHKLIDKICQIHSNDPEFGYRFIADELHGQGIVISQRRVWWLCSKAGIFSVISRRKGVVGTLDYRFMMTCSSGIFTLIPRILRGSRILLSIGRGKGKLYLCAIKDLCSRKIVGYATSSRMKSGLAVAALDDVMRKRGHPRDVIIHSDRGSQFSL